MFNDSTLNRLLPHLLVLIFLLVTAGDAIQQISRPSFLKGDDHSNHDHSDPEKRKRMGFFHFNEGNKNFRSGDLEAAAQKYQKALRHDDSILEAYVNLSTVYLRIKRFDKARSVLNNLEGKAPSHPLLHYNLACYYSLTGETNSSFEALERAVKEGFKNFEQIKTDPDLARLRQEPDFEELFKNLILANPPRPDSRTS